MGCGGVPVTAVREKCEERRWCIPSALYPSKEGLHSQRSWFPLLEKREKWGTSFVACACEVESRETRQTPPCNSRLPACN